jgi:hypothetical protein
MAGVRLQRSPPLFRGSRWSPSVHWLCKAQWYGATPACPAENDQSPPNSYVDTAVTKGYKYSRLDRGYRI